MNVSEENFFEENRALDAANAEYLRQLPVGLVVERQVGRYGYLRISKQVDNSQVVPEYVYYVSRLNNGRAYIDSKPQRLRAYHVLSLLKSF